MVFIRCMFTKLSAIGTYAFMSPTDMILLLQLHKKREYASLPAILPKANFNKDPFCRK